MYKYRVIECPADAPRIRHTATESEDDAKTQAKTIVRDTHHSCKIERYNGQEWQLGSITYMWCFDRVCFLNP